MVLAQKHRWMGMIALAALGAGIGLGVGVGALQSPPLVFGQDAGAVLMFVLPDRTAEFEDVLEEFRLILEASDDPIRRQQAEHWRVFKSSDPGPNGSVLYLGFMQPVLKGANYDVADIAAGELPEDDAPAFIDRLRGTLAQPSSALSLDTVLDLADLPQTTTETDQAP